MNPFITILQNRGWAEGVTGRWIAPDYKYGNSIMVEVEKNHAIMMISPHLAGGIFFDSPKDLNKFQQVLPA